MSYNSIVKDCKLYVDREVNSIEDLYNREITAEIFFNEYTSQENNFNLKIYFIYEDPSETSIFRKNRNKVFFEQRFTINSRSSLFNFRIGRFPNQELIDNDYLVFKVCIVILEENSNLLFKNSYIKNINFKSLTNYYDKVYEEIYTDNQRQSINDFISNINFINLENINRNKIFSSNRSLELGVDYENISILISPYNNLTNLNDSLKISDNLVINLLEIINESSNLHLSFLSNDFLSESYLYDYFKEKILYSLNTRSDIVYYLYFVDNRNMILVDSPRWSKTITYSNINKFINKLSFEKNSNIIENTIIFEKEANEERLSYDIYKINYSRIEDDLILKEKIILNITTNNDVNIAVFNNKNFKEKLFVINKDNNISYEIDLKSYSKQELFFKTISLPRFSNSIRFNFSLSDENGNVKRFIRTFEILNKRRRELQQSSTENVTTSIRNNYLNNNQLINNILQNNISIDTSLKITKLKDIHESNLIKIKNNTETFNEINKNLYSYNSNSELEQELFLSFIFSIYVNNKLKSRIINSFVAGDDELKNNEINILSGYNSINKRIIFDSRTNQNFKISEEDSITIDISGKAILFEKDILNNLNKNGFSNNQKAFLFKFLSILSPRNSNQLSFINELNSAEENKFNSYKLINRYFRDYNIRERKIIQ